MADKIHIVELGNVDHTKYKLTLDNKRRKSFDDHIVLKKKMNLGPFISTMSK